MATFQDIRGQIELATRDALTAAGLPIQWIFFDNVQEEPPPPTQPFAVLSISFPGIAEDVLGCQPVERIQGTMTCIVYSPRAQGSTTGQRLAQAALQAWAGFNGYNQPANIRVRNMEGPTIANSGVIPHHAISIQSGFTARPVD